MFLLFFSAFLEDMPKAWADANENRITCNNFSVIIVDGGRSSNLSSSIFEAPMLALQQFHRINNIIAFKIFPMPNEFQRSKSQEIS